MTKHTIELDDDAVDELVVNALFASWSLLLDDYTTGQGGWFVADPVEDRRQHGEMINAFQKVIEWYTAPGSVTFDELPTVPEPVVPVRGRMAIDEIAMKFFNR